MHVFHKVVHSLLQPDVTRWERLPDDICEALQLIYSHLENPPVQAGTKFDPSTSLAHDCYVLNIFRINF